MARIPLPGSLDKQRRELTKFWLNYRMPIVVGVLVLVVSNLAKDGEPADWIRQAKTYPILRKTSDILVNLPFAKAKEVAEDIKTKGKESDILPDLPQEEQPQDE